MPSASTPNIPLSTELFHTHVEGGWIPLQALTDVKRCDWFCMSMPIERLTKHASHPYKRKGVKELPLVSESDETPTPCFCL